VEPDRERFDARRALNPLCGAPIDRTCVATSRTTVKSEGGVMGIRKKSAEQEVKGVGQKAKGLAQEVVGRATGNENLRARGELNQVGGTVRSRVGEAGRKISDAVDREKTRSRR
jgi:uncharacterized protein YjbJ (UPF0337 family)